MRTLPDQDDRPKVSGLEVCGYLAMKPADALRRLAAAVFTYHEKRLNIALALGFSREDLANEMSRQREIRQARGKDRGFVLDFWFTPIGSLSTAVAAMHELINQAKPRVNLVLTAYRYRLHAIRDWHRSPNARTADYSAAEHWITLPLASASTTVTSHYTTADIEMAYEWQTETTRRDGRTKNVDVVRKMVRAKDRHTRRKTAHPINASGAPRVHKNRCPRGR